VSNDGCRFCRLYAISLVAIACFLGAVQTVQFAVGLSKFGGLEYTWRVVVLSALRSHGPAANGSALALALLLWAQRLSPSALASELPGKLKRGLLLSLAGYPVASLLSIATSVLLGTAVFGVPYDLFRKALGVVMLGDLVVGGASTLIDVLLISLIAWRGLPALHASKLSLPARIAVAWPVLFVLRSLVGLALPGAPTN
jgi:hypothetical protein